MTETEYLASTDPIALLGHVRYRTSERKLRLFTVACCRAIWHLLDDQRSRTAVEMAERYADGAVPKATLLTAGDAAWAATRAAAGAAAREAAWAAAREAAWVATWDGVGAVEENAERDAAGTAAKVAAQDAVRAVARAAGDVAAGAVADAARGTQAALLRCVLGDDPWRPAPLTSTGCHLGQVARPLAQSIYATHDWLALPILADALEEADCDNTDVLAHLRGPGPHCRGCWCVDWILGLS